MFLAGIILADLQAMAQDMRWTTRVTETVKVGGGRRGGPANEVTREKTVTVNMKMSKASVDGKEVLSFKHSQIKDQPDADAARAEIPWSDKDTLTEALKTTISEMKRPTAAQQSDRKQIYKNGDGSFVVKSIFEGHNRSMEVSIKNEGGKNTDFTLSPQQVEVFFNLLRNMK